MINTLENLGLKPLLPYIDRSMVVSTTGIETLKLFWLCFIAAAHPLLTDCYK